MHSQRQPLLPLYETSEECFDEVPELEISSSSPPDSISSLSLVVVDQAANSPSTITNSPEKKHVKFAEVDVENIHIYQPSDWNGEVNYHHHYPGNFPHRTTYGAINPPSILRDPTPTFPIKLSKEEENLCLSIHPSTQGESRKLKTRIRLRTGFTQSELMERQKLSPLICLSGSILTMLVLFLWFLSAGDCHPHNDKDYEFGEDINTAQ